jgi:adenylate cyclase
LQLQIKTQVLSMKKTSICQGCWEQMHAPIAIRGPFSPFFRLFGIKRSQMHPNLCTICESMFTKVKKSKQIAISTTILFADLRGYTDLSEHTEGSIVNELLHCFYDQCSAEVWEQNGIINKFIGDAVLAIFNFPLVRAEHAKNAVRAAIELQKNCKDLKNRVGLINERSLGIGVGISTGQCFLGEVGTSYKDFTAVGPVVNLASRLQGAAGAGEILVTEEVYNLVRDQFLNPETRMLTLKGIREPVKAFVLVPGEVAA